MKKTNLNGQVLSEKEMKEVKGGTRNENEFEENLNRCTNCGHTFDEVFEKENGTGYYVYCPKCGSKVDVDDI